MSTAPAEPTTPDYPPLPVLMGRVLADVPAVGKNSQAPSNMGGYAFRGIEDVLAALKPAMARHGVFCIPDVIERLPTERTLQGGKVMFVMDLCIRWTFYGPAGDTLTSTCWGQGTDMGDKATQKAMTSAFKSMLMQTFVIGDAASDAEAHDVPETHRNSANPEQWFVDNGWKDRADHDEARALIVAVLAEQTEEVRTAFRAWFGDQDQPWGAVWPQPFAAAVTSRLEELAQSHASPHQDDEKAPSAPEPTEPPDVPPLPLPEPEKPAPKKRGTGPLVKCAWCGTDIKDEAAVPVTFHGASRLMHGKCKAEVDEEVKANGGVEPPF